MEIGTVCEATLPRSLASDEDPQVPLARPSRRYTVTQRERGRHDAVTL